MTVYKPYRFSSREKADKVLALKPVCRHLCVVNVFIPNIENKLLHNIITVVIMLFMLLPIYRYTLDTSFLSPEQRLFYEQNGFILIKDLVAEEDIDRFR